MHKFIFRGKTYLKVEDPTVGELCSDNPQCALYDHDEGHVSSLCLDVTSEYNRTNTLGTFCDRGCYWIEDPDTIEVTPEYYTKEEVQALFEAQNVTIANLIVEINNLKQQSTKPTGIEKAFYHEGKYYIAVKEQSGSCGDCCFHNLPSGCKIRIDHPVEEHFGICSENDHHFEILKTK